MSARAKRPHGSDDAPMRAKGSKRPYGSRDVPMRAKGPKRPYRQTRVIDI